MQGAASEDACRNCTPGHVQPEAGRTTCSECALGQHQPEAGMPSCFSCRGPAHYQNDTGAKACKSCAAVCLGDKHVRQCGGASAGYCGVCSPGRWVNGSACHDCAAGQFSTAENAAQCTLCAAGRFQNKSTQVSCDGCPSGRMGKVEQAASIESCLLCPAGSFSTSPGMTQCDKCAIGKVQNSIGSAACSTCHSGQFQNRPGQLLCKDCPDGKFTNGSETGGVICLACKAGKYGKLVASTSNQLSAKFTEPTAARNSSRHCQMCPPTYYQPREGAAACQKCEAKYACPAGSTFQAVCNSNEFVVKEKQECRTCPRIGPNGEATCTGGVLQLRDGFFSSSAHQEGHNTTVNADTIFTKCPCTECCKVNSYTGQVECILGTDGPLCAVCQKAPVRFHRQLDDTCPKLKHA